MNKRIKFKNNKNKKRIKNMLKEKILKFLINKVKKNSKKRKSYL